MPAIFFAFAIDYKFLHDQRLVVFELGDALQSNPSLPHSLYGRSQFDEVILFAREIAKAKQLPLYYDYDNHNVPIDFDVSESIYKGIATPQFYDTTPRQGIFITQEPDACSQLGHYSHDHLIICNAQIEPVLKLKWLFDYVCQQQAALTDYIPVTRYATRATLPWVKAQLPDQRYYVKHSDGTRGTGTHLLAKARLDEIFKDPDFVNEESMQIWPLHQPFLIQDVIQGDTKNDKAAREITRRAFVMVSGDADKPENLTVKIVLPYYSAPRTVQDDHTEDNEIVAYAMTDNEQKEIDQFARQLVTATYSKTETCFKRHWQHMVEQFILHHKRFSADERALQLSLIMQALRQENYCFFDKIQKPHLLNLEAFIDLLSPEESVTHSLSLNMFFCHSLIGDTGIQEIIPREFANKDLVTAYKKHLSKLENKQIAEYSLIISRTINRSYASSCTLWSHLPFLQQLLVITQASMENTDSSTFVLGTLQLSPKEEKVAMRDAQAPLAKATPDLSSSLKCEKSQTRTTYMTPDKLSETYKR